jgi:hypothetical protein
MTKTVLLTSTSSHPRGFNYRLKNGQLARFDLAEYALNVPVDFPSEEEYESFKVQAAKYFQGEFPILIEGRATASKAETINEKAEKTRAKRIRDKADAAVSAVAEATLDSGVKLSFDVESNKKD